MKYADYMNHKLSATLTFTVCKHVSTMRKSKGVRVKVCESVSFCGQYSGEVHNMMYHCYNWGFLMSVGCLQGGGEIYKESHCYCQAWDAL